MFFLLPPLGHVGADEPAETDRSRRELVSVTVSIPAPLWEVVTVEPSIGVQSMRSREVSTAREVRMGDFMEGLGDENARTSRS